MLQGSFGCWITLTGGVGVDIFDRNFGNGVSSDLGRGFSPAKWSLYLLSITQTAQITILQHNLLISICNVFAQAHQYMLTKGAPQPQDGSTGDTTCGDKLPPKYTTSLLGNAVLNRLLTTRSCSVLARFPDSVESWSTGTVSWGTGTTCGSICWQPQLGMSCGTTWGHAGMTVSRTGDARRWGRITWAKTLWN